MIPLELDAAYCNARMWERIGCNAGSARWRREIQRLSGKGIKASPAPNPRLEAARHANTARGEAVRNSIVDALTEPMTTAQILAKTGKGKKAIFSHFAKLELEGRIRRTGPHHQLVWERVE